MEPEGIYFTFPLAMPGRRIHYDAAGMATEYGRETLPGCTLDFLQASSWVAAHTPSCCVTLACPDAPLFQVGGFTFGRTLTAPVKEKKALLLVWPLNNYWCTNFRGSQPGTIRLVYEMRVDEAFNPAACARFGVEAQSAIEVHPLPFCGAPGTRTLVESKGGDDVVLLQVKRAGSKPRDLVVMLANHGDSRQTVRLRLPGAKILKASLCNTLEQPQGRLVVKNGCVIVPVGAHQIVGARMTVAMPR